SSTIVQGQGTQQRSASAAATGPSVKQASEAEKMARAEATQTIRASCHYNPAETNLKKMQKVNDCETKSILIYLQRLRLENALDVTASDASLKNTSKHGQATGAAIGAGSIAPTNASQAPGGDQASKSGGIGAKALTEEAIIPGIASVGGLTAAAAAPVVPAPSDGSGNQVAVPANTGASASGTPSTCGDGSGGNDPSQIRVHRVIMTPQVAADDFGSRLAHRFIVYQVSIENENKNYQYMLEDVSIDFSRSFRQLPGTYKYNASGQDLTLLRGVPEKGQDLDKRNAILHVLQGIGSVAGGVSGLTGFSDVMGSSVAVFNGAFLQA
ncbi:MAG: hypothetical protein WBR21_05730, partial [Rouxiella badensis]|uniref:hypothetical protein n=1 Tax=Rouxiella badensis TaxID=1646377 RepID=UPI003C64B29C